MGYDEVLAERIRFLIEGTDGLTEKRMFGGLAFMVHGHMAVTANSRGALMVRADPATGEQWLDGESVKPMEMRGEPMAGWLFVAAEAVADDDALQVWVDRALAYVRELPPK